MARAVLGIDVSKADFHGFLIAGDAHAKKSFPNAPAGFRAVQQWLKNRRVTEVHACMEATGGYWLALATALHAAGIRVSVVNPSRTALFARSQLRRTKTDLVDAQMIADFCATQRPELWEPPAPEILTLRGLLSYREQLVLQRTALRQLFAQVAHNRSLEQLHAGQVDALSDAIVSLEEQIRAHVKAHRTLRDHVATVDSIPGFGLLTAAAVVAKLPFERLRSAKAAAAYVGLTPSERQSGSSILGKPRICKTGSGQLRRDLYMPALAAMRYNPTLKAFAERLSSKGKPAKVVIVAVMRKLIVLAFTLLKSSTHFEPAHRAAA